LAQSVATFLPLSFMYILRSACSILMLVIGSVSTFYGQTVPKRLLVYYGYPSSFNYPANQYNLATISADFSQYDYVVLGDGLEKTSHPDHANTQTILQSATTNGVRFFGYIDAGVSTQNLTLAEIQLRVGEWKAMGIDGIFYDDFGYDYGVSRQRQNTIVGYAKAQGLPVIANGWDPDHVFGTQVNVAYNPSGLATALTATDYYLSESYLIQEGQYQDAAFWESKANKLRTYQLTKGFKILSLTTNNVGNGYSSNQFFYAWYGALLYNHEAIGWGEHQFAANSALNPFRVRPAVDPGSTFVNGPQGEGNRRVRYTNSGQVWIDPTVHTYGFLSCASCQSLSSGSWHTAAVWSCGRVPLACDNVTIAANHAVVVQTDNARCRTLLQQGTLQLVGNYKLLLSPQ
jgi:hypothetical protein